MMDIEKLFAEVETYREEMLSTWKQLVNRDAGSANKEGVDAVGRDISVFLKTLGFTVRFHEYENAGNMLVAEIGDAEKPFVVLTGHMDTVFADGTAAARPFHIEGDTVTGPGVLDMKGGVTILLYAVKFLLENGYDKYRLKIILAGDEEVAHAHSTAAADYAKEARGAVMGFNTETGFINNGIVIERKGTAQYLMETGGVGAHSGNNHEDGRSAVKELAYKILELEKLTDYEEGTTVNCGVIGGGTVANAVPEHAWCKIDVRFRKEEGLARVEKAMRDLETVSYVPETTTQIKRTIYFGAMKRLPESEKLFERANTAAQKYGLPEMKPIAVGGGSDSAFLTAAGVPTLCALGVKGEFNHTVREWAQKESLFERCKLLMVLLLEL